jgi:hypothetical protein
MNRGKTGRTTTEEEGVTRMDSSAAPWDDETDLPLSTPAHVEHREYLATPWAWRAFVRRVEGLTQGQRYILHVLSDTARKNGMGARRGLAWLAVEADTGPAKVGAALRRARELGLLFVAHEGRRGRHAGEPDTTNEYWLIIHPDVQERAKIVDPDAQRSKVLSEREKKSAANARAYVKKLAKESAKSVVPTGVLNPSTGVLTDPDHDEESVVPTGLLKDGSVVPTGVLMSDSVVPRGVPISLEHSTGGAPQKPGGNLGGKREHLGRSKTRCEHGLENSKLRQCPLCRRGLTTTQENPS